MKKKTKEDFVSAPWRFRGDQLAEANRLADELSLNASAVARGALDLGFKQIRSFVAERREAMEVAAEIAAASRSDLPVIPSDIAIEAAQLLARWHHAATDQATALDAEAAWTAFVASPGMNLGVTAQSLRTIGVERFAQTFRDEWNALRAERSKKKKVTRRSK